MEQTAPRIIKMGAERAIIYSMIMDVVRRCDAAYGKYQRRGSSIGATLETYMIVAAVLIGEMEGRLFTAQKLAQFLGFARGTVQRKLDDLMKLRRSSASTGLSIALAKLPSKRQRTSKE